MAVYRVEHTKDFTVMSNYHLRDKRLSLKAKGLLSQMLSLPENWEYTLTGLASINRESVSAISHAVKELETCGYVIRRQTSDSSGRFDKNEYLIYEQPVDASVDAEALSAPKYASAKRSKNTHRGTSDAPQRQPLADVQEVSFSDVDQPSSGNTLCCNPSLEKPLPQKPLTEKATQLNTYVPNTHIQNTYLSNINPIPSSPFYADFSQRTVLPLHRERKTRIDLKTYAEVKAQIHENISYDILVERNELNINDLDELVAVMVDAVCSQNGETINKITYAHDVIKSRILSLDSTHIQYVMQCLQATTTKITHIRKYLLTTLFNAPYTMGHFYNFQVNFDLHKAASAS